MMMHSLDLNGRIIAVSDFWLETLGYLTEEVLGHKLTDFFTEESRQLAEKTVLPKFFEVGSVRDVPYQMVKKDGSLIDVLISACSECDEQGGIICSLAGVVDVTELKKAEAEAMRLAHYDTLTGQPNRFLLQDRLGHALEHAHREGETVGVLFIDLDHFKWVNDTLGHAFGDQLLKMVAGRLQNCARKGDTVARLGGDEFVVVLCDSNSQEDPSHFAKRFLDALAQPIHLEGKEIHNSGSIGIAIYPMDGRDVDTLLRNADIAMYAAKESGRNNYQFYSSEMNALSIDKMNMESNLRRALKNEEFFLEFQPQLDLSGAGIVGFEALIRWQDPVAGRIMPKDFIPLAEESGLICQIGEWVLRTACRQAQDWRKSGQPPVRIAVNVSGKQFRQHDFMDMLEEVLNDTGFNASDLEIELTESVVMDNIEGSVGTLTDLKMRDIHLAIDDFGTGHSSLTYLKHFPFDRLKIAQEFVRDIPDDPEDMAIVQAIVAMAKSLKLGVIAEGVENKAQLDFLRSRRCNEMQGFYFSPPLPADILAERFEDGWLQRRLCPFSGWRRGPDAVAVSN